MSNRKNNWIPKESYVIILSEPCLKINVSLPLSWLSSFSTDSTDSKDSTDSIDSTDSVDSMDSADGVSSVPSRSEIDRV